MVVNEHNQLLLLLIFKVENHFVEPISRKNINSGVEFTIKSYNLTDQLLNSLYKIERIAVGRTTVRNMYEYQSYTNRSDSIVGNKVLSIG